MPCLNDDPQWARALSALCEESAVGPARFTKASRAGSRSHSQIFCVIHNLFVSTEEQMGRRLCSNRPSKNSTLQQSFIRLLVLPAVIARQQQVQRNRRRCAQRDAFEAEVILTGPGADQHTAQSRTPESPRQSPDCALRPNRSCGESACFIPTRGNRAEQQAENPAHASGTGMSLQQRCELADERQADGEVAAQVMIFGL